MNLIASKIKELHLVLNRVVIKPIKMDEDSFYCTCPVCGIKKVRYVKSNSTGKKKPKR